MLSVASNKKNQLPVLLQVGAQWLNGIKATISAIPLALLSKPNDGWPTKVFWHTCPNKKVPKCRQREVVWTSQLLFV